LVISLLVRVSQLQWNMGEQKRIPLGIFAVLLLIAASSFQLLRASEDADDAVILHFHFLLFICFQFLFSVFLDVWIHILANQLSLLRVFRSSTSHSMRILKVVGSCLRKMNIVVINTNLVHSNCLIVSLVMIDKYMQFLFSTVLYKFSFYKIFV